MCMPKTLPALVFLAVASGAHGLTADELIAKNLEARGGIDKLRAIQSLRQVGKMQVTRDDSSLEYRHLELVTRGRGYRSEATLQGLTSIRAYDGRDGWSVQPWGGRKDPRRLSADETKALARALDLDGPLVDYAMKGHAVEYLGTEDVDGTEAHRLKVSLADGDVQYLYLDPDYFLEIRIVTVSKVRGVEYEQETDLGNYEQVAGVYLPFSLESGPKGGPKGRKVTIEKAEVNVVVEDALFHFPTGE